MLFRSVSQSRYNAVKEELRSLAKEVSFQNSLGESKRPKRVHKATIHKLAREVVFANGGGLWFRCGSIWEGCKVNMFDRIY